MVKHHKPFAFFSLAVVVVVVRRRALSKQIKVQKKVCSFILPREKCVEVEANIV